MEAKAQEVSLAMRTATYYGRTPMWMRTAFVLIVPGALFLWCAYKL